MSEVGVQNACLHHEIWTFTLSEFEGCNQIVKNASIIRVASKVWLLSLLLPSLDVALHAHAHFQSRLRFERFGTKSVFASWQVETHSTYLVWCDGLYRFPCQNPTKPTQNMADTGDFLMQACKLVSNKIDASFPECWHQPFASHQRHEYYLTFKYSNVLDCTTRQAQLKETNTTYFCTHGSNGWNLPIMPFLGALDPL